MAIDREHSRALKDKLIELIRALPQKDSINIPIEKDNSLELDPGWLAVNSD